MSTTQPTLRLPGEQDDKETLLKVLEMEWQDHFQTRAQTWKALEVAAILTVALVGLDLRVGDLAITIAAAILLIFVAFFGIAITVRHRNVTEIKIFNLISLIEKKLGVINPDFDNSPQSIRPWSLLRLWESNVPLFIVRMYLIIIFFADGLLAYRLWTYTSIAYIALLVALIVALISVVVITFIFDQDKTPRQ